MSIISILLPIIILIGIGYYTVHIGFFSKKFINECSVFVLYIAMPSIIVVNIIDMDFFSGLNTNYLTVYTLTGLTAMLFGMLGSRLIFKHSWGETAVNSLGCGMPNSAFIGLPIAMQIFESNVVEAFLMCILIENLILIPLSLIFIESTNVKTKVNAGKTALAILSKTMKSPIIIAIIVGVVINLSGLTVPSYLVETLDILANTSMGLALFFIGGALARSKIMDDLSRTLFVSFIKLIACPVIAIVLMLFLPLDGDLKLAIIIFTAAPMMSIYPVIGGKYGQQVFCASTLLITTVLSSITITTTIYFYTLYAGSVTF
ncbi:transporter [Photobacterium sanctipauli]|uniref:Transporter n=1 Tax=Photobacterium sanctipauli TaxID=1342794 RepID=A0A2T3P161_9GAMM|nr:AEC family transporter [Photobacterium sanctipauli]PSW22219.1 transporter [Photobacterium sanctipauli]